MKENDPCGTGSGLCTPIGTLNSFDYNGHTFVFANKGSYDTYSRKDWCYAQGYAPAKATDLGLTLPTTSCAENVDYCCNVSAGGCDNATKTAINELADILTAKFGKKCLGFSLDNVNPKSSICGSYSVSTFCTADGMFSEQKGVGTGKKPRGGRFIPLCKKN